LAPITIGDVEPRAPGDAPLGDIQEVTHEEVEPRITVRDDMTSGVFPYPEINLPPIFDAADAFKGVVLVELFIPGVGSGLCTGTVINQRTVLIAAHCVQNLADDAGVADGDLQPFVYFAPNALPDYLTFNGVAGSSHIVHAGYDRNAFFLGADIALVSTSQPISRSARPGLVNGVPYVTLATSDPALFETVTLVGYGQAGIGSDPGVAFDLRRRVATNQVDYVGASNDVLGGGGTGQQIFTDFADPTDIEGTDYFCAFFWGPSSCTVTPTEGSTDNGDSGGPLFVSNGAGGYTQAGITSGGANACGGPGGGYCDIAFWTSVAAYNSWIQANSPLRSVSAVPGDGLWSNAARWTEGAVPDNFKTPVASITDFTNTAKYYNVTLSAAGTTTLNDVREIDELAITGANSRLTITPTGNLFVWSQTSIGTGVLRVDGTLDTEYVDLFGGRVQGTGNIVSAADYFGNFGGTVAPGNSIGTLTVTGNYVQGATGLLEIEVSSTGSDLLAVTGSAQLGGTLLVKPFGTAPTDGQVFTILTATSVTGTFSSVLDELPGLFTLRPVVYGANFVQIEIDALAFAELSNGPIQDPVATALDALGGNPGMATAINNLQQLDPSRIPAALEALNPTRAHAQAMVGLSTGDLLRNQLGRRTHDLLGGSIPASTAQRDLTGSQLASVSPTSDMLASAALAALDAEDNAANGGSTIELANGHAMFFAADVGISETDQAGGIGKDKADVAALTAGLDHSGRGYALGGALSYLQSSVSQNYGLGGDTSSEGVAVSGFGSMHKDLFYADAFLAYAWHDFETERGVLLGPLPNVSFASGETSASQSQAGITLGYGLNKNAATSFGAVGGLYYISMDIDGYTETGAGALSAVLPSRSVDSLRSQLGGEVAFRLEPENETLVPILRVVWNHEFEDDGNILRAAFAGAPTTTFAVPGPDLGSDWATVGFGLSGRIANGTSFYLRYQHDIGRDGQDNQEVSAAARMTF